MPHLSVLKTRTIKVVLAKCVETTTVNNCKCSLLQCAGFCAKVIKEIISYNIISPLPFLLSSPPICHSLFSLKLLASFPLIVLTCIYVYTYVFLNITCLVCIMLHPGMISGMAIVHSTTNLCALS